MKFKEGDSLIGQGDHDTVAYLITSGWVQVRQKKSNGEIKVFTLEAGEVVGELGLAGLAQKRTATVIALTDGEVEVIDQGALIRLVNGPGSRLTPLLAALFSRLKTSLMEDDPYDLDDTFVSYAKLEGENKTAKQALCNQPCIVSRLPWVFGAFRPPQSVTDLVRQPKRIDVKLAGCSQLVREEHIIIEVAEAGGLQLRLVNHGDYCELDDIRVGYGKTISTIPLSKGQHTLVFGDQACPFSFNLQVLM
ncbi:MAG: cyclic nucleotide-binding domain-containing protein [Mariprofundaceae bacterium]